MSRMRADLTAEELDLRSDGCGLDVMRRSREDDGGYEFLRRIRTILFGWRFCTCRREGCACMAGSGAGGSFPPHAVMTRVERSHGTVSMRNNGMFRFLLRSGLRYVTAVV